MKALRFLLVTLAVASLALPPSVYAETVCNTYTFRMVSYDAYSGLWYCGNWAYHNCTECVDTNTGGSCYDNGGPCEIGPLNPA